MLTDQWGEGLRVVVVGAAVTACAARRGHHHAGPGDGFWQLLHESGMTDRLFAPQDDALLPAAGVGLTDLVTDLVTDPVRAGRRPTAADAEALRAKVARYAPAWVAFHGKGTAAAYALAAGHRPPPLGRAPWVVGGSPVFVLPSASGANRRASYDGRPTRLEWWQELAALLG